MRNGVLLNSSVVEGSDLIISGPLFRSINLFEINGPLLIFPFTAPKPDTSAQFQIKSVHGVPGKWYWVKWFPA